MFQNMTAASALSDDEEFDDEGDELDDDKESAGEKGPEWGTSPEEDGSDEVNY